MHTQLNFLFLETIYSERKWESEPEFQDYFGAFSSTYSLQINFIISKEFCQYLLLSKHDHKIDRDKFDRSTLWKTLVQRERNSCHHLFGKILRSRVKLKATAKDFYIVVLQTLLTPDKIRHLWEKSWGKTVLLRLTTDFCLNRGILQNRENNGVFAIGNILSSFSIHLSGVNIGASISTTVFLATL